MNHLAAQSSANPNAHPARVIKKLPLCWLALVFGVIGAHWMYARQRRFVWFILTIPLSAFWGWAECMRYGLMNDTEFNRRFNPHLPEDTPQTNGLVVTAVALALGVFTTALMSALAMLFQMIIAGEVA